MAFHIGLALHRATEQSTGGQRHKESSWSSLEAKIDEAGAQTVLDSFEANKVFHAVNTIATSLIHDVAKLEVKHALYKWRWLRLDHLQRACNYNSGS